MSLLSLASVENSTGEVKEIFQKAQEQFGVLFNGLRIWAVSPEKLSAQWDAMSKTMAKDPQTVKMYTILRYILADKDECTYCIGINEGMLINMFGLDLELVENLQTNPLLAPLDNKHKALMTFALQAVTNPDSIGSKDINSLKEFGASEMEIFDVVYAASYTSVVNTLFKTFKIEKD